LLESAALLGLCARGCCDEEMVDTAAPTVTKDVPENAVTAEYRNAGLAVEELGNGVAGVGGQDVQRPRGTEFVNLNEAPLSGIY